MLARLSMRLALVVTVLTLSSHAQAADPTVPAHAEAVYTVEGRGVQIYRCTVQHDMFRWSSPVPEAKLFEPATEKQLGTHSEGPTWTWTDDSAIRGTVVQRSPSPDPASIPWLLLSAQPAPGAAGALAKVAWVRRSETHGGASPASGCDRAHPTATVRVPYTAVYTFYRTVAQ